MIKYIFLFFITLITFQSTGWSQTPSVFSDILWHCESRDNDNQSPWVLSRESLDYDSPVIIKYNSMLFKDLNDCQDLILQKKIEHFNTQYGCQKVSKVNKLKKYKVHIFVLNGENVEPLWGVGFNSTQECTDLLTNKSLIENEVLWFCHKDDGSLPWMYRLNFKNKTFGPIINVPNKSQSQCEMEINDIRNTCSINPQYFLCPKK